MSPVSSPPLPRRTRWRVGARALRRIAATAVTAGLVAALGVSLAPAPPAAAAQVTPRDFTGYGFDQCVAPTQAAMNAWLRHSPFWAVGIYISGDSRGCRTQPNLTPAWVGTQVRKGWRLLPITLGPQASCSPHFPRYGDDETVNPSTANTYAAARRQGRVEARSAVAAARRLGIDPGSTLWYDMEAYDIGKTACRESAMFFTSAWTRQLHNRGYVSGVYSSAASHIKAIDDARVGRPNRFALPDRIWIARWDGVANTSTSYIRADGWLPGNRMKQYRGGHLETHGGVTINIDSNYLDLGKGSASPKEPKRCGGVKISYRRYPVVRPANPRRVDTLQCLLKRAGVYDEQVDGVMDRATRAAIRAYRVDLGLRSNAVVGARVWTALHTEGKTRLAKHGARSEMVRRLQRALNSASTERLPVRGVFESETTAAVKRYQRRLGRDATGVVTPALWRRLQAGRV